MVMRHVYHTVTKPDMTVMLAGQERLNGTLRPPGAPSCAGFYYFQVTVTAGDASRDFPLLSVAMTRYVHEPALCVRLTAQAVSWWHVATVRWDEPWNSTMINVTAGLARLVP